MNKVITLWSPTAGGTGTSLSALNITKVMGQKGFNVALLDFDLKTPSLHYYLGSDDVLHSLDNVIPYTTGNGLTSQVILNNMQKIEEFSYLRGTNTPEQAQYISIESLQSILEVSKTIFDYIIIDTHGVIDNAGTYVALEKADKVFIVTEKNAMLIKQYDTVRNLLSQNFDMSKFRLIVNKCDENIFMELADIEDFFKIYGALELPLLSVEFINAINQGKWISYLYSGKKNTLGYIEAIENIIKKEIINDVDQLIETKATKRNSLFSFFKR